MRPARRPGARAALPAAAAVLALVLATVAHGAGWDLDQLMALLAARGADRAAFNETRHLAILDAPLESSGELVFTPPDRLEKHTTSPGEERLVVQGGTVTVERHGQRQSLSLADHPEVAALVESIRGTLAGDRAALERTYRLALAGDRRAWRLTLTPREPAVRDIVRRVRIEGSGASLQRVRIEQADGDRSLLQIAPPRR